MMHLEYVPYTLQFRQPAGTSRGVLQTKKTFFVKVWDDSSPNATGYGEAAWFEGLSKESETTVTESLRETAEYMASGEIRLPDNSAARFGVEQALLDFSSGGNGEYFNSPFIEGTSDIVINGLVWMGDYATMLRRLKEKVAEGFRCIKIKIGAVKWEDEMALLEYIRENYGSDIIIRVDANGGLSRKDCMRQLDRLAKFGVHSIEQPIPADNWEEMAVICRESPVPVALDEELIGKFGQEMEEMLDYISPAYIVLKPALCGGFKNTDRWIRLSEDRGIGWWITSALESSVGLDALAQYVGSLNAPEKVQGLGTGNLYTNNLPSPLRLDGERLRYTGPSSTFHSELERLFSEVRHRFR